RQHRMIGALVGGQVALTMTLLLSTGLLLKSAVRLRDVRPGFEPTHVLTMTISLPNNKFAWQYNAVFSRDVVERAKATPSVIDAAVVQGVPMRAGGFSTTFVPEGMPSTSRADWPVARMRVISPGYFRVMRIP